MNLSKPELSKENVVSFIQQCGSLTKAAELLGVSKQRISQKLKKAGYAAKDIKPPKQEKPLSARRIEYLAKREADRLAMEWGCKIPPSLSFVCQKNNAKKRGIDFKLSFVEWWGLWRDKYQHRGRAEGEYVMCRNNDNGHYEIGNVRIDTSTNNALERIEVLVRSGDNRGLKWMRNKTCNQINSLVS